LCNSLIYIIMKTIRNNQLFEELQAAPRDNDALWGVLFGGPDEGPYCKDPEIPVLTGGLDHVEVTKTGVYFHDIGCNGEDNSFVIRRELPGRDEKREKRSYYKGFFVIYPDDRYYDDWMRALNFWHYPGVFSAEEFLGWLNDYPRFFEGQRLKIEYDLNNLRYIAERHPKGIFYIKDFPCRRGVYDHKRHMPVGPPRYIGYASKATYRK